MVDRKQICKCGIDVGDLLNDITRLQGNLQRIRFAESPAYIPSFRGSVESIYNSIRKVEDSCAIDAREEQQYSIEALNKVSEMETNKNATKYYEKKDEILSSLNKIRSGTIEKVRDCSK